jgi:flagellar motor switch protein FliM
MAEDQDDLAAEWGLALADQGVKPKGMADLAPGADGAGDDDMAAQWAAMIEDGGQFVQAGNKGGAERILNQDEIDSLLGFNLTDITLNEYS